jgi:hypothetical protein
LITVDISTSPRCLSGVKFSVMIPGGWIGSYASVASFPAYFYCQETLEGRKTRMIAWPPGCSGRNSVTSYALP